MKGKFLVFPLLMGSMVAHANLVADGGFENPTPNATWYSNSDGLYDFGIPSVGAWTVSYGNGGVWRPTLGANTFTSLPGGRQAGWLSAYGEYAGMYQYLSGVTLQANEKINLSGYVGTRADLASEYGLGGTGYISLFASNGTLLATSGAVTAAPGTFEYTDMSYTATVGSSLLGDGVVVELSNGYGSQASFDNILASASSAPGPAAFVPFALIALGRRFRRA
jgi:hypothetical protein